MFRIWLKGNDLRGRINALKVQNRKTDMTPAINNIGRGTIGLKEIGIVGEDII